MYVVCVMYVLHVLHVAYVMQYVMYVMYMFNPGYSLRRVGPHYAEAHGAANAPATKLSRSGSQWFDAVGGATMANTQACSSTAKQ